MRCSSHQCRGELNFPGIRCLLITSRDKLTFYDFFCDFQHPPIEFHYFTLEFFTFLLVFFSFLLVFTCVPLVFTCVHLCSTCAHLCSLVFHLCSLVFHLCSLVFHLCSLVFTCVHLCSLVFICVPLVWCFRLDGERPEKYYLMKLLLYFSFSCAQCEQCINQLEIRFL